MGEAHQGLNLRSADFTAFIDDLIGSLKADQVSTSDIQTLVTGTFNGFQTAIVQTKGLGDSKCTCPNGAYDGGDAGSCLAHDIIDAGDGGEGGEGGDAGMGDGASTDTGGGDDGSGDSSASDAPADAGGGGG
jgi:hypothetical protein